MLLFIRCKLHVQRNFINSHKAQQERQQEDFSTEARRLCLSSVNFWKRDFRLKFVGPLAVVESAWRVLPLHSARGRDWATRWAVLSPPVWRGSSAGRRSAAWRPPSTPAAPRLCARVPSAPIPPAASRAAAASEMTSCPTGRKVLSRVKRRLKYLRCVLEK